MHTYRVYIIYMYIYNILSRERERGEHLSLWEMYNWKGLVHKPAMVNHFGGCMQLAFKWGNRMALL